MKKIILWIAKKKILFDFGRRYYLESLYRDKKIEGCSYKPENKYYEVVAKEEGTCPSEAINNLDKSIKRPFQYKKINANLLP